LLLLGVCHPAPLDPDTPLDPKRTVLAWLTFVTLGVTFIPAPFSIAEPAVRRAASFNEVSLLPTNA
jgi:hypothetical protein